MQCVIETDSNFELNFDGITLLQTVTKCQWEACESIKDVI